MNDEEKRFRRIYSLRVFADRAVLQARHSAFCSVTMTIAGADAAALDENDVRSAQAFFLDNYDRCAFVCDTDDKRQQKRGGAS